MKISVFIAFLFLFNYNSFAQQYIQKEYDTTSVQSNFCIEGVGIYGATSLQNDMLSKLIFGGAISGAVIASNLENHSTVNRFGFDVSSRLEYQNFDHLIKGKYGWMLQIENSFLGSMLYTKDLFHLTFQGNSGSDNGFADVSGTSVFAIGFQKIGFGFVDQKTKSSIALNYYNISNYFSLSADKFLMNQSEDFSSIGIEAKGGYESSSSKDFMKGYGVGIDFDFRIPLNVSDGKDMIIQFTGKNIGFVNYSKGISSYSIDSTYSYNGLQFNQLYGDESLFDGDFKLEDTLNVSEAFSNKLSRLPGFIEISKMVDNTTDLKLQSYFGVRIHRMDGFAPLMFIGGQYKFDKIFKIGSHLTVGGYAKPSVGINVRADLKKVDIGLSTNNVYGSFARKGYGKSLLFYVRCGI